MKHVEGEDSNYYFKLNGWSFSHLSGLQVLTNFYHCIVCWKRQLQRKVFWYDFKKDQYLSSSWLSFKEILVYTKQSIPEKSIFYLWSTGTLREATYPLLIDSRHGYDIDTCQIFIGASSNLKREIGLCWCLKWKPYMVLIFLEMYRWKIALLASTQPKTQN